MTYVAEEIASQPGCWRRALSLAARTDGLPDPGERVAVVGCGTSLYMAQAYAALRERAGQGETDAFPASEVPPRRYDRVVAISRSGTTSEVVAALAGRGRTPAVVITAVDDTPAAVAADDVVVLDFADERSVVQTRFATTCLALLRAHLGTAPQDLPDQAELALTAPLPPLDRRDFAFLGAGWTVGLAREAALKLTEAAGMWTAAYPAMEYRHGPISAIDENSLVWFFGAPPAGLVGEVRAIGATVVAQAAGGSPGVPSDPLADLIRAQRVAVELATARGLDPDRPRHLTRSVILSGSAPES
jgi:fructoselysine-6-P-deglycase FrlB-like protein